MKIAGCLLLFVSCCLIGYSKAFSYKSRIVELENIIEIINYLEMEITYRKENLRKAFSKASNIKKCWFSNVLKECVECMEKEKSLSESWALCIKNCETASLKNEDLDVLKDLVIGLGKSDIEGQRKLLNMNVRRLHMNLDNAKCIYSKQGKMYKGLGIAAGATLSILLI